ncbi:UNVERIFIED_CONTAM: hypothetical protein GTU68_014788, partial [Idotea baltica]|nr:hypothetical protein [Idotea baltica]
SGDTGGAVAAGFYNAPNIDVIVLYPKDKVSDFQERQITTWGGNITAIEIDGNFDDCQALVKQAFLDDSINTKLNLSSANSINLARLIPQTIYYFEALKNLIAQEHPIAVSVPSGNFGNLTAGVFAQRLGLPISQFIAATNVNNIVPQYLKTGTFEAKPSIATISNAMDVGNPSNFPRLLALFNGDWAAMAEAISGYELSDKNTLAAIDIVYKRSAYLMDPHTAIGYDALKKFIGRHPNSVGIVLSTAHPIKFESALESISGLSLDVPASVEYFYKKDKKYHKLSTEYAAFKDYLSSRLN